MRTDLLDDTGVLSVGRNLGEHGVGVGKKVSEFPSQPYPIITILIRPDDPDLYPIYLLPICYLSTTYLRPIYYLSTTYLLPVYDNETTTTTKRNRAT
jgi:hypothetical protein